MYSPPAYVSALTIAGPTAIAAATCIALYGGVVRAGLGRRRATLLGEAVGITIGALTAYGLLRVTPSTAPSSQLPLALVIAAAGPLMIALHITSLVTLARAARPTPSAVGSLISGATPRAAVTQSPASCAR